MLGKTAKSMMKSLVKGRSLLTVPKCPLTQITNEIQFTPNFYEAVEEKLQVQEPGSFLRLEIFAGQGCQGFTYKFKFDQELDEENDFVKQTTEISSEGQDRQRVIFAVNGEDIRLLHGATVDYAQQMMRQVFYVKENPNAEIECSCKTSFSPKQGLF